MTMLVRLFEGWGGVQLMDARESADFLTGKERLLTNFAFDASLDQVGRCGKSRERSKDFAGRHDLKAKQRLSKKTERSENRCDERSVALMCISETSFRLAQHCELKLKIRLVDDESIHFERICRDSSSDTY